MTATISSAPDAAPIEAGPYREAMALVTSAVHLVTTDGPAGRAGFTATAVCSVSDAPPTLLVCINRSSSAYAAFKGNSALCVSTLGSENRGIAGAFGGKTPMDDRFAAGTWHTLKTGVPVLNGALVAFDCRIVERHLVGTHDVLYCEVQAVATSDDGEVLVYYERGFHTIQKPADARPAPAERHTAEPVLGPSPVGNMPLRSGVSKQ